MGNISVNGDGLVLTASFHSSSSKYVSLPECLALPIGDVRGKVSCYKYKDLASLDFSNIYELEGQCKDWSVQLLKAPIKLKDMKINSGLIDWIVFEYWTIISVITFQHSFQHNDRIDKNYEKMTFRKATLQLPIYSIIFSQ